MASSMRAATSLGSSKSKVSAGCCVFIRVAPVCSSSIQECPVGHASHEGPVPGTGGHAVFLQHEDGDQLLARVGPEIGSERAAPEEVADGAGHLAQPLRHADAQAQSMA